MPSQVAKEAYIKLLGFTRPEWVASLQKGDQEGKGGGIGPVFSTLAHTPDDDASCQGVPTTPDSHPACAKRPNCAFCYPVLVAKPWHSNSTKYRARARIFNRVRINIRGLQIKLYLWPPVWVWGRGQCMHLRLGHF